MKVEMPSRNPARMIGLCGIFGFVLCSCIPPLRAQSLVPQVESYINDVIGVKKLQEALSDSSISNQTLRSADIAEKLEANLSEKFARLVNIVDGLGSAIESDANVDPPVTTRDCCAESDAKSANEVDII